MNHKLLNKKWSSYYNYTTLYPTFIMLAFLVGILVFIHFINFNDLTDLTNLNDSGDVNSSITKLLGEITFFAIAFLLAMIPYFIWFFIASDSLAKMLGLNRVVFNILNILLIVSFFYFITIFYLSSKVKETHKNAGLKTKWSGKLK